MKKVFLLLTLTVSVFFTACQKETIAPVNATETEYIQNSASGDGLVRTANQTPYYWANTLVQNILPANNTYQLQMDIVTWTGQHGATAYWCTTVCSGFVTQVLIQTYNYTSSYFHSWTGSSDPNSAAYYEVITAQNHFTQINSVSQIAQGDFIALKYPAGSSSSGHMMIVASAPVQRTATTPIITGTAQYEISVIDCSESGHGPTDTRYISNGVWHMGAGRGIFRVYTNSSGNIVGYCWSTYSNSTYYTQSQRQLAVGRLIP